MEWLCIVDQAGVEPAIPALGCGVHPSEFPVPTDCQFLLGNASSPYPAPNQTVVDEKFRTFILMRGLYGSLFHSLIFLHKFLEPTLVADAELGLLAVTGDLIGTDAKRVGKVFLPAVTVVKESAVHKELLRVGDTSRTTLMRLPDLADTDTAHSGTTLKDDV